MNVSDRDLIGEVLIHVNVGPASIAHIATAGFLTAGIAFTQSKNKDS